MTPATATLWEISDELLEIEAQIHEAGGEITPEIEAQLDALEGSFHDKVERIALLIEERVGDAEKARGQEQRLASIRKAHEGSAKELKGYLERCMAAAGIDRVERPNCRVRRYKNSTPSVICTLGTDEIPADYVRVIPETRALDSSKVVEDFKAEAELPEGIEVVYGYHVRIL